MPVFQVDVQTRAGSIYVTNLWHVQAADMGDARDQAVALAHIHAKVLPTFWAIDSVRASTPAEGDNFFATVPLDLPGERTVSSDMLPPFCRYLINFQQGFRRPCRKFIIGIPEGDTDGDTVKTAAVDFIQTQFITPLFASTAINACGPTGILLESGRCSSAVGMRQLRRASKRKSPVI